MVRSLPSSSNAEGTQAQTRSCTLPQTTEPMPSIESRLLDIPARWVMKGALDTPRLDVARVRRALGALRWLPRFAPRGLRVEASRDPALKGEWHVPADVAPRRTILHLHGGGFIAGAPVHFRSFASWLAAQARARVLVLDYRLAPEHPFPAALEDAIAAVRALYALGTDHHALGIVGDSAGGALALGTLLAMRDAGEPLPAAAALVSPLTDAAGTGETLRTNATTDVVLTARHKDELARMYAGQQPVEHPLISPLYADLRGLPSLLIHASESEILFDDARRLAEKAHAANVAVEFTVYPGMMHDFHQAVPLTPESRHAVRGMAAYFARRIG